MIKASHPIEPDAVENLEDALYELAPSNWSLIVSQKDGTGDLEGFFDSEKDARLALVELQSILGQAFEKPFRIENFYKKIFTTLGKISNSKDMTHKIGPFTFFPLKKFIILEDNKKIDLTEKEVDILKCLIGSGKKAVDRDKLLKQVWNYSPEVTTHTLETHIYRLRQKLETDPSIPRLIISKGGGFRIR